MLHVRMMGYKDSARERYASMISALFDLELFHHLFGETSRLWHGRVELQRLRVGRDDGGGDCGKCAHRLHLVAGVDRRPARTGPVELVGGLHGGKKRELVYRESYSGLISYIIYVYRKAGMNATKTPKGLFCQLLF